ncbi:MAG: isoprenylcysteine carboxylmethyltransferase family protein [Alphaproteobacteria bacterium]|nr:isoprenylcysteine carboxylmethyltransferase family protein [Alphaproteobacteria bacterium]
MKNVVGERGRRWLERVVRVLLGLGFAMAAGAYFRNSYAAWQGAHAQGLDHVGLAHALSSLAVAFYTALMAGVYAVRHDPINKFAGLFPTVAAFLGGFLMVALLFLDPRDDLSLGAQMTAFALVLTGNVASLIVLSQLGRSFSILPEGRKLVTHGIYAYVRHPLYVAEAIGTSGIVILFFSPAALGLFAAQLGWQFVRMHYEEKVLRETFPSYEAYARRTKRLLPGVY